MTHWMKSDDISLKGNFLRRTFWEYKTKNYASYKYCFSMVTFMGTDVRGALY